MCRSVTERSPVFGVLTFKALPEGGTVESMSLEESLLLVVSSVIVMFVLIFVLATVEERMFDAVLVSPDEDEAVDATADTVTELSRAA